MFCRAHSNSAEELREILYLFWISQPGQNNKSSTKYKIIKQITTRQGKFIATVSEGSPSYYNSLMRLQIMNVSKEDLGKYTCKAKNSLGGTSGEITLYGGNTQS